MPHNEGKTPLVENETKAVTEQLESLYLPIKRHLNNGNQSPDLSPEFRAVLNELHWILQEYRGLFDGQLETPPQKAAKVANQTSDQTLTRRAKDKAYDFLLLDGRDPEGNVFQLKGRK